ncbi:MAG: FISUMP domain-containing protein, partial [Bacteroidota bacterium]
EVNPLLPVSVSIVSSANPICSGISAVFNASAVNSGNNPNYQWTVNGVVTGGNSSVFTYLPTTGDFVQCQINSNYLCAQGNPALSNIITLIVNLSFPVGISIVADPPGSVCSGNPITYTGTPVNGGSNPHFQWKVNGINAGTNLPFYTYQPVNSDIVTCELNSNLTCTMGNPATSNSIIVLIGSTPVVTYSPCNDIVTATNAKPFKLRGGLPLGGVYSGTGVNSATGIFDPLAAGAGAHQITYTYTSVSLCSSYSVLTITNRNANPVLCGSSITDYRDSKVYPTVQIGSQCWFRSNLNFGSLRNSPESQVDNCVDEKYCLSNSELNCTQFGALYQWDELMRYETVAGGQGLCPPGWHVPTDTEWLTLFNFFGGQSFAGDSLKKTGTGSFRAIPGGVIYQSYSWSFYPPGLSGTFFWTSEGDGAIKAKSHGLNSAVKSVSDYLSGRENAFSVRCLLD